MTRGQLVQALVQSSVLFGRVDCEAGLPLHEGTVSTQPVALTEAL